MSTRRTSNAVRKAGVCSRKVLQILGLPSSGLLDEVTISVARSHKATSWKRKTFDLDAFACRMMKHRVGEKAGSAWSPFTFQNDRRGSENALETWLAVFDCDLGDELDEIVSWIMSCGYAAVIVSSHSHRTTRLEVSLKEWDGWQAANRGDGAEIFLTDRGYAAQVASGARVVMADGEPKIVERNGIDYVIIRHAPCPKFRVIFFAKAPWRASGFPDARTAERVYKAGLRALAREIDLTIDESALDLARLYFDPRHPEGARPEAVFVGGDPVDPWSAITDDEGAGTGLTLMDVVGQQGLGLPFEDFHNAVMTIRNDERFSPRNEWIKVLAAIHAETKGSEEGFELANRWSASWTAGTNDREETRRVWASFRTDRGARDATGATIVWLAQRDGWVQVAADDRAPHGDIWNGVRFAEQHRRNLLYVATTQQWLRWDSVRWRAITQPEIEAFAKRVSESNLDKRLQLFLDDPADRNKALITKATQVHASLERVRKIAQAARSEPGMAVHGPGDFDCNPMQLCVSNGILDLAKGRLIAAQPDHMVSKLSGTSFDKDARAPRFESFLCQVQPDPEVSTFLQRAVGYTLTGSVDEEKLFFMFGTGANGKSVFANIIAALLGEYSVALGTAIVARNKHENEAERLKARLPGARLALVNETGQGEIWDDQRIKELASRERISARLLHREAFDFMPTHKLWIRGNHLLGSFDPGHGFWRRMVPIEFGEQIDEAKMVPDLDRQIISAELPGILNWALDGCLDWQRDGLQIPASIRAFTKEYRDDTDILGLWFTECCEPRSGGKTTVADAYNSYRGFCDGQGMTQPSQRLFSRMMTDRKYKRSPKTSTRAFIDFVLKSDRGERFKANHEIL